MGQRISFFKNESNKGLKDLIRNHFSVFRQSWLDATLLPDGSTEVPYGQDELYEYLKREPPVVPDFDQLPKQLLDELTADFVANPFSPEGGKYTLLTLFGSNVGIAHYEASKDQLAKTKDYEMMALWNHLINGRSLKDHRAFTGLSGHLKIGFLTRAEAAKLQERLLNFFGKGSKGKKNEISAGIEYMLDALSMLKNNNPELITLIG